MSIPIKTMVLTGASRGIGHATVKRFSAEGWRIITCSRDAVPDACKRDPNWSAHIPTDLSDPQSVASFVDQPSVPDQAELVDAVREQVSPVFDPDGGPTKRQVASVDVSDP